MIITLAAEGVVDTEVALRLCQYAGHSVHQAFPQRGKSFLDRHLAGYNNAARLSPWLILRDLDHDAACAPTLVKKLLPAPSRLMLLRVAVRAIEAWLLADAASFADFFATRRASIPTEPDTLANPKRTVLDLIRGSAPKAVRDAMLPRAGTTSTIGADYSPMLIEFTQEHWRVEAAMENSPSLRKCVDALAQLGSR